MAQPIRKQIAKIHPELAEKTIYTLLVDGTFILKVCEAASMKNSRGEEYGALFTFLIKLKTLLKKKDFDYVYVFFDDENSGILRYELYKEYKANRDKNYSMYLLGQSDYARRYNETMRNMRNAIVKKQKKREITDEEEQKKIDFARQRDLLMKYFEELFIRCMFDSETEGDDMIAYYVMNKKPNEKIVIATGDMDLSQLLASDVCIWNPKKNSFFFFVSFKTEFGYPSENVLIKKIFCGDASDNIGNIEGVSDIRLMEIMPEMKERPVTVDEIKERTRHLIEERISKKKKPLKYQENILEGKSRKQYDGDFYEINEKIINLRKPLLTDKAKEMIDEARYNAIDPEGRSLANMAAYMREDDITELLDDRKFASFFIEFNALANREKKRFETLQQH